MTSTPPEKTLTDLTCPTVHPILIPPSSISIIPIPRNLQSPLSAVWRLETSHVASGRPPFCRSVPTNSGIIISSLGPRWEAAIVRRVLMCSCCAWWTLGIPRCNEAREVENLAAFFFFGWPMGVVCFYRSSRSLPSFAQCVAPSRSFLCVYL